MTIFEPLFSRTILIRREIERSYLHFWSQKLLIDRQLTLTRSMTFSDLEEELRSVFECSGQRIELRTVSGLKITGLNELVDKELYQVNF